MEHLGSIEVNVRKRMIIVSKSVVTLRDLMYQVQGAFCWCEHTICQVYLHPLMLTTMAGKKFAELQVF